MSCLNLYKIRLSDKSKFIVKHKYASVNSEDINMTFIFRLLQIQMEKTLILQIVHTTWTSTRSWLIYSIGQSIYSAYVTTEICL